jgi:hypothetical protein
MHEKPRRYQAIFLAVVVVVVVAAVVVDGDDNRLVLQFREWTNLSKST